MSSPSASEGNAVYRLPVQMLGDLVAPRTLSKILQEATAARGSTPEDLDANTLEDILKKEVYKRLQLNVPASLAKKRVSEVLNELMKHRQTNNTIGASGHTLPAVSLILGLEEAAKAFTLYFDWPETQRLRGVISVARQEEKEGRSVTTLVNEGQDLINQMQRRLDEGLVAQGQDLAELQASFVRVESMGNREVRRLENLITQIDEAQKQNVLLPGEVERARNIMFKLRRLLESSVMQPAVAGASEPNLDAVVVPANPVVEKRVFELEQEHVAQQLVA